MLLHDLRHQIDKKLFGILELHKKILAPVVVGDTLHLELEVLEVRPTSKGGRGIVKARHDIINQLHKTVITYEATRMIAMRVPFVPASSWSCVT